MSEHETIILINESDLAQGCFQLGTSLERIYTRVLKRIGGHSNLLSEKLSKIGNKVVWYQLRIPKRYLSKTLSIKRESSLSDAQKTARSERLKTKTHSLPLTNG